jgi:hypothetical protein
VVGLTEEDLKDQILSETSGCLNFNPLQSVEYLGDLHVESQQLDSPHVFQHAGGDCQTPLNLFDPRFWRFIGKSCRLEVGKGESYNRVKMSTHTPLGTSQDSPRTSRPGTRQAGPSWRSRSNSATPISSNDAQTS